jgi:hypothetical protein
MKAVWDHTRSFLRHHCRRSFALTGVCDIIVVQFGTHAGLWLTATFPLLWDLAASFDEAVRDQNLSLFLRHNRQLSLALTGACDIFAVLRHHCRSLQLVANCHLPTFPLLWDLAASFDEAVRDQNLSLFLLHNHRLVAASSPAFISAHRRLRLHCRLTTSLSFIAALMPTCG